MHREPARPRAGRPARLLLVPSPEPEIRLLEVQALPVSAALDGRRIFAEADLVVAEQRALGPLELAERDVVARDRLGLDAARLRDFRLGLENAVDELRRQRLAGTLAGPQRVEVVLRSEDLTPGGDDAVPRGGDVVVRL